MVHLHHSYRAGSIIHHKIAYTSHNNPAKEKTNQIQSNPKKAMYMNNYKRPFFFCFHLRDCMFSHEHHLTFPPKKKKKKNSFTVFRSKTMSIFPLLENPMPWKWHPLKAHISRFILGFPKLYRTKHQFNDIKQEIHFKQKTIFERTLPLKFAKPSVAYNKAVKRDIINCFTYLLTWISPVDLKDHHNLLKFTRSYLLFYRL